MQKGERSEPSVEDSRAAATADAKPTTRQRRGRRPQTMSGAVTALKLFAIKIIFGKDGITMMAMFFAQRVILGKTTFEAVPKALKAGVAEVLIDSGLPELVPVEYGGTMGAEETGE